MEQAKNSPRAEREKKNAEAHAEVLGKYGVYPDKELQAYVNEIGQKVAAGRDQRQSLFSLLLTTTMAFARRPDQVAIFT